MADDPLATDVPVAAHEYLMDNGGDVSFREGQLETISGPPLAP